MDEVWMHPPKMIDGCCGIGLIKSFRYKKDFVYINWTSCGLPVPDKIRPEAYGYTELIFPVTYERICHRGGTGMFQAAFINRQICKDVYHELLKHHPVVFQTPVRLNKNTSNAFFMTIFDEEKKNDVSYIEPMVWPWSK